MCWTSCVLHKHKALDDFIVYKLVKFDTFNTCKSLVYNYTYIFEKLYKLESPLRGKKRNYEYIINEGFHSCAHLHSLIYIEESLDTLVVECTIPKGATYYVNGRGEVVSDKIIIHTPNILSKIKQFIDNNK